jgi:DtxR family Mn-dependent transcriptional regulator
VLRHHRLLERFLHEFLGYSWDEVHEEAERLEHYISERLEDRIAARLGDPAIDPHGHVIPERGAATAFREEFPLRNWVCGVPAVISSVSDKDPAVLRELERLGLLPGIRLVVESGTRAASVLLRINGESEFVRVSQRLAGEISVVAG